MYADLILLIGVFNKEELFCSSNNFLESFVNETPFCTLSGKYIIMLWHAVWFKIN